MLEPKDILFIGIGTSAVAFYRCFLPALHMGADWIGVYGEPPDLYVATGLVANRTALPKFNDYKVVVIQQPAGSKWLSKIRELQEQGVKVLYEVDDYLHGVRKQDDHDFKDHYGKDFLQKAELCMRVCDGIICSTEWLGRKYRSFNKRIYVCENAIDIARYRLTRPERPTINLGWSGATGHLNVLTPWFQMVSAVMERHKNTCFVSVGQPGYAKPFQDMHGEHRAIGVPWTLLENYPAAMTMMDVAIAPAGKSAWWRGKSDLRWLEAGALGIPVIASPQNYPKIEHGVTGFHAETQREVYEILSELVTNEELRNEVGANAKRYVEENRDIRRLAANWLAACDHLLAGGADHLAVVRS